MAFIGTPLDTRNTFQSLQGKRFNGDGSTTAFTLDVAPSSTLDIEVFVGNVRQDPNSAYTLSGTTLTFTGAPPSGTNNIYVVHQAKAVGTIEIPATTGSEKTFTGGVVIADDSDGSNGLKIGTGDDFKIYHDGTHTYMDNNTGALFMRNNGSVIIEDLSGNNIIRGIDGGAVDLYHNGVAVLTTNANGFSIPGTTPTLTIGDAGAEDTKIVFDGNAQDYHIGLDDSADDLVIGLGSTLGTTSHIVIDEAGHVTKPLNPAFRIYQNTADDAAPNHTMFNSNTTEVYDVNADMGTNGSFTAPVTGKYIFTIGVYDINASDDTGYDHMLVTSNRTHRWGNRMKFEDNTTGYTNFKSEGVIIADMDANDTAYVKCGATVTITNGGNQEHAYYSGILIG